VSDHKHCQLDVSCKGQWRTRSLNEETSESRFTCCRTYQGDFQCERSSVRPPQHTFILQLPSTGAGKHRAQTSKESQLLPHLCQPGNHIQRTCMRHCQRVGSSFRRNKKKKNCTFYILHYMWLCTICWYPDDGDHVWNIWYLAFSRWHEIKCIIHRVNLCFCNCCDKNPLLFQPLTCNLV